jgi:hypothetical protein
VGAQGRGGGTEEAWWRARDDQIMVGGGAIGEGNHATVESLAPAGRAASRSSSTADARVER